MKGEENSFLQCDRDYVAGLPKYLKMIVLSFENRIEWKQ